MFFKSLGLVRRPQAVEIGIPENPFVDHFQFAFFHPPLNLAVFLWGPLNGTWLIYFSAGVGVPLSFFAQYTKIFDFFQLH